MLVCDRCGAETTRGTLIFTEGGKMLPRPIERCSVCCGSGAVRSATDRKLWQGHEVYEEHYRKTETPDGETIYQASESMIADLVAEWSKDPDAEKQQQAEEWKRRNRRTRPLSSTEIEQATRAVREEVDVMEKVNRAIDAGLMVPADI